MSLFIIPASLTNVDTENLADGAVTYAKLGDVDKWQLLETQTASSAASITLNSFSAKAQYKVVIEDLETSTISLLSLVINSKVSGEYNYMAFNNSVSAFVSAANSYVIGTSVNSVNGGATITMAGVGSVVTGGNIGIKSEFTGSYSNAAGRYHGISGHCAVGTGTQVNSLQFGVSTGTFSGRIKVYGRD